MKEHFGNLPDGSEVTLYRLENGGITAEILSLGGIIHRLLVPDKDGKTEDIVFGADDVAGYLSMSCAASVIGRFANRISEGRFTAGGKEWITEKNAPGNCTLHSGSGNYAARNFTGSFDTSEDGLVGLKLDLRDNGEGGFPGGMDVTVTYTLDASGNLRIRYEGTPEADTPISMTNHVYFNLSGHASGSVEDHICQLDSDYHMTHYDTGLPTGDIRSVRGTDFDFTSPQPFKRGFNSSDPQLSRNGYDHNFCIRGRGMRRGGVVKDPKSGRCLEFFTDLPGVQLYTGLHLLLKKCDGKDGAVYSNGDGFCLETQHYPDSVNMSQFPSPMYKAGEKFESETVYRFFAG